MGFAERKRKIRASSILVIAIIIVGTLSAGLLGYSLSYFALSEDIKEQQNQLSTLQNQLSNLQMQQNVSNQNNTYVIGVNVSLSQLYLHVKDSVVTIRGTLVEYDFFGRPYYSSVQGSGFIYNFSGQMVAITNNHVIDGANNITLTFDDGESFSTSVLGSDQYEDLAVLTAIIPASKQNPLEITSSSDLEVGDPAITVGNPYGLSGSMTTGIVSALGRTISEETTGGYPIASVIQTTAPINPGNSGGPLLNYEGEVIGITTAIVTDSQGLGFAIPSNAILREIESLVKNGSYDKHPTLGVTGTDMTYEIAKVMSVNVTYGWLIVDSQSQTALHGGTRQAAIMGNLVTVGGDIIIAINGTRIANLDDLSTYLEESTTSGQTISVSIIRENQAIDASMILGSRSAVST